MTDLIKSTECATVTERLKTIVSRSTANRRFNLAHNRPIQPSSKQQLQPIRPRVSIAHRSVPRDTVFAGSSSDNSEQRSNGQHPGSARAVVWAIILDVALALAIVACRKLWVYSH
jgi:hypothetical protein